METICIKYQILFSGKNKKNISKCHLLEVLPRVISMKVSYIYGTYMFASTCFFCLATFSPSGSLTEPEHDKNYNKTCVIGEDSE